MARKKTSKSRKKKSNLSGAIKRPGALTSRAKRNNRSVSAQARHDKAHGTPLQKRQGNYFLNVLKGGRRRKKK